MRDVMIGYAMLGLGGVMRYEKRRDSERGVWPAGEPEPPWVYWLDLYVGAPEHERSDIEARARAYLEAWRRRPEPPSEEESFDQFKARIVEAGESWTPQEVSLALRCTPTLVRQARLEADRNPETGKPEGSVEHARTLIAQGLSLRQVAMLTGIPKSTLSDALRR